MIELESLPKRFSRRDAGRFFLGGLALAGLSAIGCAEGADSQEGVVIATVTRTTAPNREELIARNIVRGGSWEELLKLPTPPEVCLEWPVIGSISSYIGPSHPLGIDIDMEHDPYAKVRAATDGTVTFAGGNECCSFGLYVVMEHHRGFQTLYAHLRSLNVKPGDKVTGGSFIGVVGRTGYSSGPHLHFGVLYNGQYYDPLLFLENPAAGKVCKND